MLILQSSLIFPLYSSRCEFASSQTDLVDYRQRLDWLQPFEVSPCRFAPADEDDFRKGGLSPALQLDNSLDEQRSVFLPFTFYDYLVIL